MKNEFNRTFTVKKNSTNFSNHVAKTPQNTGGGNSQKNVHHLGVASEMPPRCLRDASVSIYSCQSDFSSRVWKYAAMLLMVFMVGIGNVWGETVLKTIDFSSSEWSNIEFKQGNTETNDVFNGVTFRSKNSSNKFSISDGKLEWPNSNMGSSNYFLAFPVENIVDGTLIIKVYNGTDVTAFKYDVKDGATSFSSSSISATDCGSKKTQGPAIAVKTGLSNANKKAYVYLGRFNGDTESKKVSRIVVSTPGRTDLAASAFYPLYASTNISAGKIVSGASFPSYMYLTSSEAMSTNNGKLAELPNITSPYDFDALGTSNTYYRIKTGSSKSWTIQLYAVSHVKSVRFYGNANGGTGRKIVTTITKVAGDGGNLSVDDITLENAATKISEYSTGDLTSQAKYDANTYYTYSFTIGNTSDIWGIYVEYAAPTGKTLQYNANGGTGTTMENTTGTGTVTLRANTYTKSGCTFQGWATSQANANAGTVAYEDEDDGYNLSADATLYAVWKLNAPAISCEDNVVTMTTPGGATVYYTIDGSTTPTSESTPYDPSSKPVIDATTTFKAIAILANHVSSNITTQECVYAAALPEVAAPTGLSSTAQTATSLTFGWTTAEHASSYDVYLYTDEGCLSLATPTESNPQNVTTTSATFTGLTVSTTYYCKVQSKGDGTSYKVNGGITATAASEETPCTAITPTWVYPFTKIAVGITPSNPIDGNLGDGTVTYSSSATSYIDNNCYAKAAGSATITANVAAANNYCAGNVTSGTIEVVADQTGIITQTLTTGNNAWNASTPTTTDGTNITNLVALHAVGFTISTSDNNGNDKNGGQTAKVPSVNAESCDNNKYLEMSFTVADGKQLNVSAIYIPVQPVTSNSGKFKAILSDGTTDIEGTVSNILNGKLDYIRFASFGTLQGNVTLKIYAWNWSAGYRLGRNVIIAGTVENIPVSCSAYEFHYGTKTQDNWETACFTQVGETKEWRIEDFTVPSTTHYYVGYHGDGEGTSGWNAGWSAEKQWTDTYSDGNGAMVLLPGTSAVGQATNATGTLIIWSNSGDKNKYVGFKPDGYGITYGGSSYAFAATETEHALETEVVTLPDVSTTYTMGLATATEGTYVACAHSASAEAISNMSVSNIEGGKKKVYLYTTDEGWLDKNPKMAVYDYTAGHACWGDGTEATKFMTKVNDNLWYGYVQSDATNLILARVNPDNDDPAWDWGQSQNITLNSADSYDTYITITGWDGNATFTKGFVHPATGQKGVFRIWDNSSAQNWYVNFVPYYTLSYDGNGASGSTDGTERCAESSTLTVSVAANGFTAPAGRKFAGWAISQDHADAGTVDYEAGADYSLTSDATLYAVWESNCPTTGTVFGWTPQTELSDANISAGTHTYTPALPGDYLTSITGGTVELFVNSDGKIRIKNSELNFNGGDSYIHVTSACELQEGDEINVSSSSYTKDLKLTLTSTKPSESGSKVVGTIKQGTPFIIEVNGDNADLDLVGETEFYIWRSSDAASVGTLTINRPAKYAVSYESAKGEAPAGGTVSSVTLAEITGVSGWKNTGWKANVATEVAGETVAANTLIENGTKVTVKEATTFTAQWAELYMITTGSPANGTVEADKASAVAGATITLTATPASGYKLSAWDVYKTDDASTKVSVTNNQFTMPAYGVTISAEFVESVVLYDYAVMAEAGNKSFTDEDAGDGGNNKDRTFGTEGNPQLIISKAGWDSKGNINNCFIKYFSGTSSMSVVIPAGRKATVTIKYGSYDKDNKYLKVNGVAQAKPLTALDNSITTENFDTYMRTVELTNQTGTLVLTSQSSESNNNIYIAYVDVTLTGYASYNVTYHLNDGAWDGDAGAATYTYGTGIATLATNVTKLGHDFADWYGNEGLTGDAITSIATTATGDKEFWAAWTPKSYTLTWNWDGGSCSGVAGTNYTAGGSVAYGAAINYPDAATMSKDGAAFAGWSTSAVTMPAEALTITALWAPEHAITYKETKGATNTNPETYVQGVGVASFAPLADVANFHFTGWSPTSIGTDATEDMDVTAQWVAAYNVTFSAGEGSGTVPATFQKWATATFELPGQGDMVAPAGKVFVGWKANGAGETRAEGYEYTMTAAAVEFVAQWKAVTLLINYDGENYSLNTTDFQTGVELVDGVAGYAKQAKFGNTTTSVTGIDVLSKGIIYHTKTNATKVTITAYNNYGSNSTSTFHYSVVAEGVTSTPSVTNKTLDKFTGDSYEINMTGRSTLYIMTSQKELRICQVEIEENGTANKVAPDVEYSVNLNKQRPFLPAEATIFEGITYRGASSYKPVNGQVQISTCGTDYYSFTIPEGQTRQLQLTVNGNSKYIVSKTLGDNTEAKKVSGNKNFNLTAGTWYINPQGSNVNVTTIAFDETPDPITVAFNSNGGSEVASQALFAGDKVTVPTTPTKSGYRFVGWQKSGADYDFATTLVAGDAPGFTLDAVWQQVWTVTFDSDGGCDVAEAIVDAGLTVAQPADPTKAGHAFDYWYKVTGEEGQEDVAYVFSTAVAADMTLKAHWHELQDDPSLGSLSYDGNAIELSSGVESEGVITYTYELPYNVNYTTGKLVPVPAAGTATLSDITYTPATKTASFSVTTADGPVVQNYAVVFTNAPKDQLCLVWAEMTADNTLTLDEDKSYLDIEVTAAGGVKEESTPTEYQGYTGYKFRSEGSYAELKDGNFKSGDKVDVFVVSAISDKMRVYAANEAIDDNIVAISENNMVQGHNLVTMTADAASLYLRRGVKTEETYNGWNPHIAYIAVYRAYPVPVVKTITFNGAAGVIDGTTITATIPYTTNMASLPIEATFMSNDPGNTTGNIGGPWTDNDGVYTNSYVVTDKDGDTNTYSITLTRAEVSHDASLTALAVEGYEISFASATLSYDVQLPYGATVGDIPAVTYTAATGATAVKTDAAEMPGYTTIAVTAEDGSTVQEYSIYFHANQIPSIVIYDGTTEMEFATESNSQLVTWTSVDAGTTIQNSGATINNKEYAHNVKVFGGQTSASRNMDIVIPADYMAKFYLAACSNSDSEADIYITKDAVGAKADAVVSVSGDRTQPAWSESDFVAPGHYFLNATNSTRLYELSVTLYPIGYTRNVTAGRLGTICLPHGGTMRGAAVYEVAYFNPENKKIYFDEVLSGEMEPGMPYVFLPDEGNNDELVVMYGNNVPAATAGHKNGLYGSFTEELLEQNVGNYIFSSNLYWLVNSDEVYVGENRAYLKVAEIYCYAGQPIPPVAHGRRRITMDAGAQAPQVTTGVDEINVSEKPVKLMIKGQIYILRGEKMYDVTGKVVK